MSVTLQCVLPLLSPAVVFSPTVDLSGVYHSSNHDAKLYANGYEIYLPRTNFRVSVVDTLQTKIPRLFRTRSDERNCILDIGCGDGLMTDRYLSILNCIPGFKMTDVVLVEPAKDTLELARSRIERSYPSARVYPINSDVDRFLDSTEFSSGSFNWIIASYVFYHFNPSILTALLVHLQQDGYIMITLGAPNHPLRTHPQLEKLGQHGDSKMVEEYLKREKRGRKLHFECFDVPTELDINGLIDEQGYLTREGLAFFSFIFNKDLNLFSPPELLALQEVIRQILVSSGGLCHHHHHLFLVSHKHDG